MEQQTNKTNAPTRKVRFAPKAPTRRAPKLEVKTEVVEDTDAVQARDLLQRLNQISAKTKPKVEKKVASSQVAFGFGAGSTSIKTFGASKGSVPTPRLREEKEYKEPWDYYSYYPVTLPMRRPYSGNPEFLDEEEFALANATFEEDSVEPAIELGLMLPPTLPMTKQTGNISGNETNSRSKPAASVGSAKKTCCIEELPADYMMN
ncbi:DNA-directed RNA polymerase III subunit RPC4 [Gossypium australe]|uniref:DNA-directed RNA polymerase III subunit RPC4 n=1 Tax=Gossypium australe TaxID=47621 RepID=A0A5B6X9L3_9ROSI|nr:DNA-directed RNA polymerase III subunit RPC4 [Gossypium australe]